MSTRNFKFIIIITAIKKLKTKKFRNFSEFFCFQIEIGEKWLSEKA